MGSTTAHQGSCGIASSNYHDGRQLRGGGEGEKEGGEGGGGEEKKGEGRGEGRGQMINNHDVIHNQDL